MRSLPWAATLLVAGCAQLSIAPPLMTPKNGGPRWFEVTSAHFVVHSALGAAAASDLALQLEQIQGAFEDLISTPDFDANDRIEVVDFARRADYVEIAKQFGQPGSAAYFTQGLYDVEP
ncbi:MAG TPA: hypothetical protein VIA18_17405, partial [Polyangia bacterium]|nr:hypothetical protein [Polyangia bacterium]